MNGAPFTKYLSRALRKRGIEVGGHRLAISSISVYHPTTSYLSTLAAMENQGSQETTTLEATAMELAARVVITSTLLLAAGFLSRLLVECLSARCCDAFDDDLDADPDELRSIKHTEGGREVSLTDVKNVLRGSGAKAVDVVESRKRHSKGLAIGISDDEDDSLVI